LRAASIQKALQDDDRGNLIHHFAMFRSRPTRLIQNAMRFAGGQPLIPQVHRQFGFVGQQFGEGLGFLGLAALFPRKMQRVANDNLLAVVSAGESGQRPEILARLLADQGQSRLRGQAETVGNGDADATVSDIQSEETRYGGLLHTSILRNKATAKCRQNESHHTIRGGNQKNLQVKWELRRLLLLAVIAALLCAGLAIYLPAGPHSEMFVEIPAGTGSAQIAALLKSHGLIWSRYAFDAMRLVKGGTLKAGEYRFDHPARMSEVYARLERGDVYTRTLTIPEGANMFDVAQRVEAAQLGSKEAFLDAVKRNVHLISDLDPSAQSVEGYLFPDTYQFQRKATADQIIAAMVKQFRQTATNIDLTQNYHNIVTMASLVERETPISSERPVVASVFSNRLSKGMPLMTDPSVIYADLLKGNYKGTIYHSDLDGDSPYNTYKHAGLPPGPICNPGIASLEAAMTPATTQYLYFVAASTDPSGHSRFAKTLEEHQQNVEAYRRAQRAAGER